MLARSYLLKILALEKKPSKFIYLLSNIILCGRNRLKFFLGPYIFVKSKAEIAIQILRYPNVRDLAL